MALRWPFAEAGEVLDVLQPLAGTTSDSPLRTLKRHGVMSEGIRIWEHRDNRLAGSTRVYSTFNLDAARASRRDERDIAEEYAGAAAEVESEAQCLVEQISVSSLRTHRPRGVDRELLLRIASLMEEAQRALPPIPGLESLAGRIDFIEGARMRVTTDSERVFDLPYRFAERLHLRVGDPVFVTREDNPISVLVTVEAALSEDIEDEVEGDSEMSDYLSAMLQRAASPAFSSELHQFSRQQQPWLATAEHIAG